MPTAEEILKKIYEMEGDEQDLQIEITLNPSLSMIKKAINQAMMESIKEAAGIAKSEWVRWGEHMGHQVEKQSILKLLDKIK